MKMVFCALSLVLAFNAIAVERVQLSDNDFEASGVLWWPANQSYLVVGDGQNRPHKTQLAWLSAGGTVSRLMIDGLGGIKDLESMAVDKQGYLYLLSSLTKGSHALIKLARQGTNLVKRAELPFASALALALQRLNSPQLAHLFEDGKLNIDIEGMAFTSDGLLLGLRRPLLQNGQAAILKITNITAFLNGQGTTFNVSLAHSLPLRFSDGEMLGISDLALCGNSLFVAAAPSEKQGRRGAIFQMNNGLQKLRDFQHAKPEGVSCHRGNSELMVVFDHGEDGSEMGTLQLTR